MKPKDKHKVLAVLVWLSDGRILKVEEPSAIRDLWLVSMPPEYGGHGVGVFLSEKTARNFADHASDDKQLAESDRLWEEMHNAKLSPHSVRKISGVSILELILEGKALETQFQLDKRSEHDQTGAGKDTRKKG